MEYGLGKRVVDESFPFAQARAEYNREVSFYKAWIKNAKKSVVRKPFNYLPYLRPLNHDQKQCLDMLKDFIRRTIAGEVNTFIINGNGGVGKTTVLYHVGHLLHQHRVKHAFVSPTGSAGQALQARTIHSFCGISSIKQPYANMITEQVYPKVRERLRDLQLIVVEEAYLGGLRLLSMLLRRIAYVKKSKADQCVSLIISGDPYQLNSCLDYALTLIPKPEHDDMVKHAGNIYHSAKFKYTLTTNVRQKDDERFALILDRLRLGKTTQEDIEALSSRLISRLSQEERDRFFDSVHLFYPNYLVDSWNFYYLSCQNVPVRKLEAQLIPQCHVCKRDYPVCFIGEGIELMLQRNTFNEGNLCNGSRLVVKHAYYTNDDDYLPQFVACVGENYKGPKLENQTVPITYLEETIFCPHSQEKVKVKFYPLKNCKALTFFKSQGLTLPSVVICLDSLRFNIPALYTALSRATALKNIMILSKKPLSSYFPNLENV